VLIKSRTALINHVRGIVKCCGQRLPSCSSASFAKRCREHIPEQLNRAVEPVISIIEQLNTQIRQLDRSINELCQYRYPEAQQLQTVTGVGPLTALAYILTIEDRNRFSKSRQVGAFLGLTPRRDQSGQSDKQLPITKAGNCYLRQLLVSCAQYVLGPFGPDSDLRRFGLSIAARGGKNAKKRAAVAVARKLAVLLHRIWLSGEDYQPFYQRRLSRAA
jgi:transposase